MFKRLICKIGVPLCALAVAIAPMVSDVCRIRYYQPEEPDGLKEFAQKTKKR